MAALLKILVPCLLVGVLVGCFLSWRGPGRPPLSRRQQRDTERAVTIHTQTAARDTARAARADSAATKAYTSGQAAARQALHYHRLTLPSAHAPIPASPSAATTDSLQRLLSAY